MKHAHDKKVISSPEIKGMYHLRNNVCSIHRHWNTLHQALEYSRLGSSMLWYLVGDTTSTCLNAANTDKGQYQEAGQNLFESLELHFVVLRLKEELMRAREDWRSNEKMI
jgi:hypothetical protein